MFFPTLKKSSNKTGQHFWLNATVRFFEVDLIYLDIKWNKLKNVLFKFKSKSYPIQLFGLYCLTQSLQNIGVRNANNSVPECKTFTLLGFTFKIIIFFENYTQYFIIHFSLLKKTCDFTFKNNATNKSWLLTTILVLKEIQGTGPRIQAIICTFNGENQTKQNWLQHETIAG